MSEDNFQVRTPWFRPYSDVRMLLTLLQGVSKAAVRSMLAAIDEQTGTPQNPVDWSDPQVNCLKRKPRIVFGRANFDVLRLRVLCRV